MAYKRRYRPKKRGRRRFGRRKNYVSKKTKFGIVKSLGNSGFHHFKESRLVDYSVIPDADGNAMLTSLQDAQPPLNSGFGQPTIRWNPASASTGIVQWDHYKSLFNRYQITGIRWKLYPKRNTFFSEPAPQQLGGRFTTPMPTILRKSVPNRTTTPATMGEFLNMDPKAIMVNGDKPVSIYWKAPPSQNVVQTSTVQNDTQTVSNLTKERGSWFNAQNPVNHYGGLIGMMNLQQPIAGQSARYEFTVIETVYWNMKTQV